MSHASITGPDDIASPPLTADEEAQGYRFGRVLAKAREPVLRASDRHIARRTSDERIGIRSRRGFSHLHGQEVLEFDRTRPVPEVIRELEATGEYEFVEPDRVIHALAAPNDPAVAGSNGWNLRRIKAPEGWDIRTDASSVIVAVIDSGARLTHEDLQSNLWRNTGETAGNNRDDDGNGYIDDIHGIDTLVRSGAGRGNPADDGGHGSHVAGIIGAVGNNGRGTAGVAWRVQLMPLKFLPAEGKGSTTNAIACINYAIAKRAHLINASYGSDTASSSELNAIREAGAAGIIFVAAAGNDGKDGDTSRHYPSSYPLANVVSVAATSNTDNLAGFSNYGSGSVDLGAPGENIYSTLHTSDNAYGLRSGTSMAAPHVTGALALMRARFTSDSPRQLINRLLRSVDPVSALNGRTQTGGRLNLQRALSATDNRPFNDDFSTRARLGGPNVRARSSNVGGTREPGEPNHAGVSGGASLWWQWTAATDGLVTFETVGSDYDTLLAVYTGNDLGSLNLVASDDNSGGGVTSRIGLTASRGTTYQIAVDGRNGAAGFTVLRIGSVPSNNDLAAATVLTGETVHVESTNLNATKQPGEPNHAGVSGGRSVWYRWTAPTSGTYQLAAFSTDMDTVAAVYTGTSVSSLTTVAANDDLISSPYRNSDALVTFSATSGTTYYFAIDDVDSSSGDGGAFTLTLNPSLWQAATTDDITGTPAVGADGTVYIGSTDGYLYAFSASGTYRWRYRTAENISIDTSAPTIAADGTIYTLSTDGALHAVNSNGSGRWRFPGEGSAAGTPALAEDGTIYYRTSTALYALTPQGAQKWRFALDGDTYCSPVVGDDGTIYIGSTGRLYAVNPSGSQKWSASTVGDVYSSPAIGEDGTIYVATLAGGRLYAFRPDGSQRWSIVVGSGGDISSSPVIGPDGTLYLASYDQHLYAISSNGNPRWSYRMGDETRASSPAVDRDGTIYIGSYDQHVHAVSSSGALLRKYATAGRIRSSMTLAGGRLYFGSLDAKVYAFAAVAPADSAWPQFQRVAQHDGRAGGVRAPNEEPEPPPPPPTGSGDPGARVINISTLAQVGTGEAELVGGFVLRNGPRRLLIRGVGPALAQLGVSAPLADPVLTLHRLSDNTIVRTNDDWGNDPGILAATQGVAFSLPADSKDAAMVVDLPSGSYTATVASAGPGAGPAIVEIYELAGGSGRFINLATRTRITGDQTATAGFVLREGRQEVLVRVAGPALANFGIAGPAADPKLELYRGENRMAENDDWPSSAAHSSAFAFPAGSKDAALRVLLDPGEYTVVARSGTSTGGIVLIEVYAIDP